MMTALKLISLPLLAYLLGSVPWGLVLTRLFTAGDIRRTGSGNIGATNVRRVAGPALGLATLAGDLAKGAVPVWLATTLTAPAGNGWWCQGYLAMVAPCAVAGHLYPIYTGFKGGGKGVATAAGCWMVISPLAALIALMVFVMTVCWCNRVSAGSIAGAGVLPVAVWKVTGSTVLTALAGVLAAAIIWRHRTNIGRLIAGREPKTWS